MTNEFLQNYRVLCVTTDKASERMWREYAEGGQGIALRITPGGAKDSKFQKFAPVTYQEKRPPVFAKILDFAAETMFGDQFERARAALKGIIYAKTNDYNFESEYRLAIPLGEREEDYRVLAYHPEEISELYLGAAMKDADKQEIIATAKAPKPGDCRVSSQAGPGRADQLRRGDTAARAHSERLLLSVRKPHDQSRRRNMPALS